MADRTNGANNIDIGSGRRGFRDRNLGLGQAGTIVDAQWANGLQEEVVRAIESLGVLPSAANREQLIQAMRRLAGGNVRTITTSGVTLTADDAGLVQFSAAGAIACTLPAANSAGGLPLRLTLARVDSAAAIVTIQRAGADTIEGAASIALLPGGRLTLISDGASAWRTTAATAGRLLRTTIYTNVAGTQFVAVDGEATTATGAGTFTALAGTTSVVVEAVGGGGSGGPGQATGGSHVSFGSGGASGSWAVARYASGLSGVAVTVGAGGVSTTSSGGAGGTSSFGALLTCPGGGPGASGLVTAGPVFLGQGAPGAAPSGTGILYGTRGMPGLLGVCYSYAGPVIASGQGASCPYGGGGINAAAPGTGAAGSGFGSGGAGSAVSSSSSAVLGGSGAPGIIIVREYA